MARSYRQPIMKARFEGSSKAYNRAVRAHNNNRLRHAVANDELDDESLETFETKTVVGDYDYCDSRYFSDEDKHTRK